MANYWIERRETGLPRYRVAYMRATVGVIGFFWTRRGAERWIRRNTWCRDA